MSCTCSIETYTGETELEFLVEKWTQSEDVIECKECNSEIVCEGFFLEVFSNDGRIKTWVTCKDCFSIREYLFCDFTFGSLWEDLHNHVDDGYNFKEECIAKLTLKARGFVTSILEEKWAKEFNE